MFFKEKKSSFSSRFFSQIRPLSSLEEAVETEVFHSQPGARTEGNRTCPDCRGEQQGKSLLLTFKQTIQNSFLLFSNDSYRAEEAGREEFVGGLVEAADGGDGVFLAGLHIADHTVAPDVGDLDFQ